MLSHVQLFATPCTVANQAPLSMEFSRQEYWRNHVLNLGPLHWEHRVLATGPQGSLIIFLEGLKPDVLLTEVQTGDRGSMAPAVTFSQEQEPRGSSIIEPPVPWHQPGVQKLHSRAKSGPRRGQASLGSHSWSPLHTWRFALEHYVLDPSLDEHSLP